MAMISFAFSIHNFISSVGADAGFAAIVGLAILVLLYFAHARETANLRDEAAMLTERLQQAETRVTQLTRAQAAAGQDAAPVAAAPALPADAVALFAPAGTGAPALASATRVVPVAASAPQATAALAPASAPAVAAVAATPAVAAAAASARSAAVAIGGEPPAPPTAGGPTVTVPPTAGGPSVPEPAAAAGPTAPVPAPATAAASGGNGAGYKPAGPSPVTAGAGWSPPPAGTASRPGGETAPRPFLGDLPPLDGARRSRRSRFSRGLAIALAALAVVAAAVVLVAVTSLGGTSKSTPTVPTTNAPGTDGSRAAAAFKPSSVTVAVLNGTSTNQLAHRVGGKLVASGYRQGTIATAANQTETTTGVAYLPGATNRNDALHVAAALGLHASTVRPVDQSTLQVACPVSTSCTTNVVVTVGADLATL